MKGKIEEYVKKRIGEICEQYGWELLTHEVMPDHIHLILDVNPKIGIYKIVQQIKGYTSYSLRKEFPSLKSRIPTLWTRSKFIASVGCVSLEVVKKYIEEQKTR